MLLLALLGVSACASKVEDSPKTLQELAFCKANLAETEAALTTLRQETNGEKVVFVEITGEGVTITPGSPSFAGATSGAAGSSGRGQQQDIAGGTASIEARTTALNASLRKSRGALQRCYQKALKKNTKLRARPVSLRLQIKFNGLGKATRYSQTPRIDAGLEKCVKSVAMKWTVPGAATSHNIAAKLNLSPQ